MDDPIYSFVFPDPARRVQYTPLLWKALIHTCLLFGRVYTTPALEGVACWTAPGNADLTPSRLLRSRFALPIAIMRFPRESRQRMLKGLAVLDSQRRNFHPRAFWYLQALGVEPSQQGKGIGSSLLAPILALADSERLPCYLETETEGNVAFYQRKGFQVSAHLEFPEARLHLWTMQRPPNSSDVTAA
jgi:ribosomal protein S18 acetylase RimI-like enzyme